VATPAWVAPGVAVTVLVGASQLPPVTLTTFEVAKSGSGSGG